MKEYKTVEDQGKKFKRPVLLSLKEVVKLYRSGQLPQRFAWSIDDQEDVRIYRALLNQKDEEFKDIREWFQKRYKAKRIEKIL